MIIHKMYEVVSSKMFQTNIYGICQACILVLVERIT